METGWLPGIDPPAGLSLLTYALPQALEHFQVFVLVLMRLSGLMLMAPILGQSQVPVNLRVLLTISLALLLTPAVAGRFAALPVPLDTNSDGWLTASEIPEPLLPLWQELVALHGSSEQPGLPVAAWVRGKLLASDGLGLAAQALRETLLGFLLGLGMTIVLSGLQLAGQMVDQQVGFGLGQVFNPDLGDSGSISGQMLVMLGTVAFLLLEPMGGHIIMLRTLADTFAVWPVGDAWLIGPWAELLTELVVQSLMLGLRVAAPIVVMLSLVDLALGFLGHTVPQLNIQAVGYGMRAAIGVLLIALTCSRAGDVLWDVLPNAIFDLRAALLLT